MKPALALAALLLAAPTAAAWPATMLAAPAEVSLAESPLLAGAVRASSGGGAFGAPNVDRLSFDAPATIQYCPDRAGQPQPRGQCAGGETVTGARLYVHAGGLVAIAPGAGLNLTAPATAAALGGVNVTLNALDVGPGVYAGGASVVVADATTLTLRPLRSEASLEVRGDQGFRTYQGTSYTLQVSNVTQARLEARGAFLTGGDVTVDLTRAPLATAERALRVEELFSLLRAIQPPENADRRAAATEAFGPFQLVPALLNGAVASRANLTLNDERRDAFTLLRVEDARFGHDGVNWTGSANATYMVDGDVVAPDPGSNVAFPALAPILLVAAAVAGRALTPRDPARKRRRATGHALRIGGLVLLSFLVGATLAPLLGFSPLLDAPTLALRSRVQLALLVVGVTLTAYVAIGLPSESLTRSAFAWRERTKAVLLPVAAGLAATILFIALATPVLLSFVARFVRL